MGKLGARELNVSSDIDLIYVYEDEGETDGPLQVSAHEYFSLVAKKLYTLIGETTDDGFVFRVDLALRPNGNSGPPVCSLPMLEDYLQVQGREWERFAWLKSRVVAPRASVASGRALALRSLVTPFVYRRYLDYGVFEGLRQLHRKIRDEAQRRAAGRPERANDVKLSRGGIREIEFIVQLMLVVRGGQYPEIRTRSTLRSLQRLAARGLMKPATAERLAECYDFLRRVEHRIQYLDDQQTHLLPTADADLGWIARSLGLACHADACELLDRLGEVREFVATEFDALLHDGQAPSRRPTAAMAARPAAPDPCRWTANNFSSGCRRSWPSACASGRKHPRVVALRDESKLRLGRLVQRAAECVGDGRCSVNAVLRFVDWLEPLLRRESYLALLVERPAVQDAAAAPAGHGALADAVPDAPPRRDRRAGRRAAAARPLRARGVQRRPAVAPRRLATLGPGQRGMAARHAAPCAPCRGVPHAGARRRARADGRAGGRRPVGAGRRGARHHAALGLGAAQAAPPRGAALRRHRLRQARRQGAGLRQRPGRGLPLRRQRRGRQGPRAGGLRRLRAQADHLADAAHLGRRAVRHRHRTAAERRLGAAGDLDRGLRALPARPRQQHRLDLGTPGHHAGALLCRRARSGRPLRKRAPRRAHRAARRRGAARGDPRHAREGARRAPGARPAASTSSTARAA